MEGLFEGSESGLRWSNKGRDYVSSDSDGTLLILELEESSVVLSELSILSRSASAEWCKYHGEFDPGSERTLAARFKHASRTGSMASAVVRVANG